MNKLQALNNQFGLTKKEVLDPISGLPIGPEVPTFKAPWPERRELDGRYVRLEPLDATRHSASLWKETNGTGVEARWQYLFDEPPTDEKTFHEYLERKSTL